MPQGRNSNSGLRISPRPSLPPFLQPGLGNLVIVDVFVTKGLPEQAVQKTAALTQPGDLCVFGVQVTHL